MERATFREQRRFKVSTEASVRVPQSEEQLKEPPLHQTLDSQQQEGT